METYKLVSGACLYHFDTGPFNWYIISQNGRLTVVDAGFPGHYAIFLKGIQALGYTLKDVEAIILTHAHADHMGFAERLRKETNAPIFVHTDDRAAAESVLQLPWFGLLSNAWRPYTSWMLGNAIVNGVFTMPRISKTYTFNDGDVLDIPGRPHVIHIPGHTSGEVAFHLPESNILLSGDTIITRNLLTGTSGQPQIPSSMLNDDDKTARRSIERMSELGEVTLLAGHGIPWQGEMSEAIEIARRITS